MKHRKNGLLRRGLTVLLTLALLALPVLADFAPWYTQTEAAAIRWNVEPESLCVTVPGGSAGSMLLVMPGVLGPDGSAVSYTTDPAQAIYLRQGTVTEDGVEFANVYPAQWQDCVLLMTVPGYQTPTVLGTVCVSAEGPAAGFSDVAETDWFYAPVTFAAGKGLVAGYPDGTFRPAEGMTQGQYLTILYRYVDGSLLDLPEKAVTGENWLEAAAYLDERYGLNADLTADMTRYEMARLTAAVLQGAAAEAGRTLPARATHGFVDVAADSPYFDAVTFMEICGFIDGYAETTGYSFRGDNGISRCEAATVFRNVVEQLAA